MFDYVGQAVIGSTIILSVNPLRYFKKYILNQETPEMYDEFKYIPIRHSSKYLDELCPFILDDGINTVSESQLSRKELYYFQLHKYIKNNIKTFPWWKIYEK